MELIKQGQLIPISANLAQNCDLRHVKGKRWYILRLVKVLGRSYWGVMGICKDWSESMLADALRYCEQHSDIKARNYFFNKYKNETKT